MSACKYIVVKFGYLTRGESMNVGVLVWDVQLVPGGSLFVEGQWSAPAETPVHKQLLEDWRHVLNAFPRAGGEELRDDVLKRLGAIQTYGDYQRVLSRMGPYTPFEFTEERGSIATPEETLRSMVAFFLGPFPMKQDSK